MKRTPEIVGEVKVAVISGGSSGIGLECARALLERGYAVALLARDPSRLEAARKSLETGFPGRIWTNTLDVNDAVACREAVEQINSTFGRLDWLITSAGMVEPGMFDDVSLDSHRRQMDTNYFGTLHLVQPAAALMKAAGTGGRITMISSAAAFVGIAGYSGYAPSKFAIRALGDILKVELAPAGISVSVAFPPDTDTPQLAQENLTKPEATKEITRGGGVLSPQTVARSLIEQAERGRFMLTPSALMLAFGWLHSLYAPFFRRRQSRILAGVLPIARHNLPSNSKPK